MSDIKGYLPDLYKASRYISAICDINNAEFDRLYDGLADFENDMFIDTADEDGVNRFEKCFGLVLQNDTLMERKSRIKAKMRGTQPTTKANLQAIIESYGVSVDIVEDIANYSFTVLFHQPNVPEDTIKAIVEELKPAHLAVIYSFSYYGTFEMSDRELEYAPSCGFADTSVGGYLGTIGSEEDIV